MLQTFSIKTAALLAFAGFTFVGCSRKDDPGTVLPSPEANYSRAVVYLDQARPARHDTAYRTSALQVTGQLTATELVMSWRPASKQERLVLRIPRAQMPGDLAGTYRFQALINPGQAPSYSYFVNKMDKPDGGESWVYDSWWLPSTGAVTGAVTLTAYDARQHVLSGQFQLALTGVYDPRARSTDRSRPCDLTLAGTFANVPVTDAQ
ncbi:hypothetical protein Q5H92_09260 [Hymenobacter sp. M29]|uniref:Uncharacterized protein n=1 Tax=Hymenobacter mellowenesis TaxID=3063995 RepID=A0ABT9AAU6_9BACT|nr:hypothetical protein [Hymenobacter sp. M29]MDO7846542.1 hypothetical protein [Hymenobacter sp. M29]